MRSSFGVSMMAMQVEKEFLERVVARVTAVCEAKRLILFGSFGTAQSDVDSDVDLLVLCEKVDDPRSESLRIRESLRGMGRAFDVIVMTEARFEETKEVVGGIAYPAHRYGRVLYEAA